MELNTLAISQNISSDLLSLNPQVIHITKLLTVDKINKRSIAKEFKLLNLLFSSKAHKEALEDTKAFRRYNRYKDVLAFKEGLVTTDGNSLDTNNYIHANWVNNPFSIEDAQRDFIATQGPLETTCESFWQMVLQYGVRVVVAIIEDMLIGKKCWRYWTDDCIVFGRITVECLYVESHAIYETRTLKVADSITGISNIVTHYHMKSWYDKTAPGETEYDHYVDFLKLLYKTKKADQDVPIVVNCSAGVGRTCTIICAYFLFDCYMQARTNNSEFEFSVFETVRAVKEQRAGAVNVVDQYEFLYQIIAYFDK